RQTRVVQCNAPTVDERPFGHKLKAVKLILLTCVAFSAVPAPAEEWPQWRGPRRDGTGTEQLTTKWPADGPKTIWRAQAGTGFSSLAVSDGRVYTMGNQHDQDTVWCWDTKSGRAIWKHTYAAKLGAVYYEGGPGSTPTVSGNTVFTISKWGDVFCF